MKNTQLDFLLPKYFNGQNLICCSDYRNDPEFSDRYA